MLVGVLGIIIHFIFLISIIDIYFKSPLIHGMTPYTTPLPPPAHRVVLFIADGLRADKFFELDSDGDTKVPFLRDIIINSGVWGVSHTRVPTESRCGHVALIAGFYEDVSAVTKGWKENPVEFDSTFNESRYTWAWGSPDILPMFAKGSKGNIFINTYPSDLEDFGGSDASQLDTWVFDKVEAFLKEAEYNDTLKQMLSEDKIVMFLHLLGLDTNGHAYKPGSEEYLKNIKLVDEKIQKIVSQIEEYFNQDGRTAYIFTSDHGMTDWGTHGAGHPHETLTPLVAWGAGIREPLGEGKDVYHDGLSEAWKLSKVRRIDVQQADIAPLIAALIGIPFPLNSVGVLPVEYLGTGWPHKALSFLTNARQILAQYQLKMNMKEEATLPVFFKHFRELSPPKQAELVSMIEMLMKQMRYRDAIQVGLKLTQLALKGLNYYQKYDRFALNCSIFLGFLGWMNYVILLIIKDHTRVLHASLEHQSPATYFATGLSIVKICFAFGVAAVITIVLLYEQYAPPMYYAYFLSPVILWSIVAFRWNIYQQAAAYIEQKNYTLQFIVLAFFGIMGLEILVGAFFKRELLSIGLVAIAVWPLCTTLKSSHKVLTTIWLITSLVMAIFPLMPVVGRNSNYNLVALAGWIAVFASAFCARRPEFGLIRNNRNIKKEPQQVVIVTAIQVVVLCLATFILKNTTDSMSNKEGLPLFNQMFSWLILASSFVIPLFGSSSLLTKLLNVKISLLAPYLLMCVSHEGLFCVGLCVLMFLWLCLEHQLSYTHMRLQDITFEKSISIQQKYNSHKLSREDFRRAYFFMFFIILAFFGTGNIASINSFEVSSVYCFLTVFSPLIMGFLILVKLMIPFLFVSVAFRAILVTVEAPIKALFLLVLLMSDFMGLHFFFMVQDYGSWLEIGTSISHYVIMMVTTIFVMVLYGVAWILTSCSLTFATPHFKRHLQ